MKTLIILKGLVKADKDDWVQSEGLENFYIKQETFRTLYSTPELIRPGQEILSRSHTTLVYSRFIEVLCGRLGKGCLVTVDIGQEHTGTLELLAEIYGYQVFYKIFGVPQDYIGKPKKYSSPNQVTKKRSELEDEVKNFMNLDLSQKFRVESYQDIEEYWKNKHYVNIRLDDRVLHISDLHSNFELLQNTPEPCLFQYRVFHGDYIDGPCRGGSREIIDYMLESSEESKDIWLEGNHDIRLRKFLGFQALKGKDKKTLSDYLWSELPDDFLKLTAPEFSDLAGEGAMKYLRALNKKLQTHVILNRQDERCYICTHAGLKWLDQVTPKYIGNVIYGNRDILGYDEEFSRQWFGKDVWSVHAHCKYKTGWEPCRVPGVINLDPPSEKEIVYLENTRKQNHKPCLVK